jgi:hypothetical protein
MCCTFIKNVLGVDQKHSGLFEKTAGYYRTVEQQGRLTLHLHMLIWLKNSLSPQKICNKIMDRSSDFQQKMVQYLESVCKGEFLTGSLGDVSKFVSDAKNNNPSYADSTKTMPEPAPIQCKEKHVHESCSECSASKQMVVKIQLHC